MALYSLIVLMCHQNLRYSLLTLNTENHCKSLRESLSGHGRLATMALHHRP